MKRLLITAMILLMLVTSAHAYWAPKIKFVSYFDHDQRLTTPTIDWIDDTAYSGSFATQSACIAKFQKDFSHKLSRADMEKYRQKAEFPSGYQFSKLIHQ